jgi:aspartate racemase
MKMKTIGMIGGSSWVSTATYYQHLNRLTNEKRGGYHAARLIMYSVNFGEYKELVESNDPQKAADYLGMLAQKVEAAGADCLLLCANSKHMHAPFVQSKISIPLLHIADATAFEIKRRNISKVSLLGTRFVMGLPFYKDKLSSHGIETLLPNAEEMKYIDDTIFNELARDQFLAPTRQRYVEIINRLKGEGAQGSILGCTEIPMLVPQDACDTPLFDTALIHSQYAVDFALS